MGIEVSSVLFLPFGGALAARLGYRNWLLWIAWLALSVLAFAVTHNTTPLNWTMIFIAGASVIGFVAPELWEACRGCLRRPRTIGILIAVLVGLYAFLSPGILGLLLGLGIIFAAFRWMFRGILK